MTTSAAPQAWNYYIELSADIGAADTGRHACVGEVGPFAAAGDALTVACGLLGHPVSDVFGFPHSIPYCARPGVDHRRAVVDHFTVGKVTADTGTPDPWELSGSLVTHPAT